MITKNDPFNHTPGEPLETLSLAITLKKRNVTEAKGTKTSWCGFRIGGGIDMDPEACPFHYTDRGVYITDIYENSPAAECGLQKHDKILQVNGIDFSLVTHKKAVDYIRKYPVLNMLVARRGVTDAEKV